MYCFNAVDFGNYDWTVPQTPIASSQVNAIASLSQTFDLTLGGDGSKYDVITDMFLTGKAGDNTTNLYEVEIFLHTPQYSSDWVNYGGMTTIGTYTGSGHTWKVASTTGGAGTPDLIFMPTDTPDVLSGTLDIKGMLDYLVAQHVLTGSEYFNGLGIGAEVQQGSGSLSINTFAVDYTPGVPAPAPTVPQVTITSSGGIVNSLATTVAGDVDLANVGSTVRILDGTTQIGTAVVGSDGHWSASVNLLNAQGLHQVTATDANAAGTGQSAAVQYTLDTVAPKIVSVAESVSGLTTGHSTTITVGASDATSGVCGVKVFDNGAYLGDATLGSSGKWIFAAQDLADGKHSFTVSALDAAGNASSAVSAGAALTVDSIAPTVKILSETLWHGTFQISFSGSDNTGGSGLSKYVYWVDHNASSESAPPSGALKSGSLSSSSKSLALSGSLQGDYLHIQAIDVAGNHSADAIWHL
ncbi:hypothetical protein SLNSH_16510 [Alsobacter soli]|uniref:Bacterial Ig-like domain-containing protein n=1 Tax=Alsobacter soli TaxID=2109933 RepID=A0A2T1HQF1_9HYPH|nr:hypothetical protein SLNSH_16510 [Alsobacter soli]